MARNTIAPSRRPATAARPSVVRDEFSRLRIAVDRTLEEILVQRAASNGRSLPIHRAMRYSVEGGKRVRPVMVLGAFRLFRPLRREAWLAACALELIHTFSLIHDDLPCLDDDALRRGRPSCHQKFGEAVALLAGDALLALAFEILADLPESERALRVIGAVGRGAGTLGMIGGQAQELAASTRNGHRRATRRFLEEVASRKTGALFATSAKIGALLGGGTPAQVRALERFGAKVGVAFQWVDDLADRDGLMRVMGPAETLRRARRLTDEAMAALAPFGARANFLRQLATLLIERGERRV